MLTQRIIRIVVAEDEQLLLNSIIRKIENIGLGFKVVAKAYNGRTALKQIIDLKPDALFTDIKMPVMDGIELIEHVRKQFPDMPIIILSGYNEFEYARKAMQASVMDYLSKPLDDDSLSAVLRKVKNEVLAKLARDEQRILSSLLSGLDSVDEAHASKSIKYVVMLITVGNLGTYLPTEKQIKTFVQLLGRVNWKKTMSAVTIPADEWIAVDEKCPNQKFIILPARDCNAGALKQLAKDMLNVLTPDLTPYPVNICVGSCTVARHDIWQEAQKLRNLLDAGLVIGKSDVLHDADSAPIAPAKLITLEFSMKVTSLIASRRFDSLVRLVSDTVKGWGECGYPQRTVEKGLADLLELIRSNLHNCFVNSTGDDRTALLESIAISPDYSTVATFVMNAVSRMLEQDPLQNDLPLDLANKIEKYLREHYTENFSLEELAGQFGFSSAYLTKVFKKYKSDTPLKFLIDIRMNEAKRLIQEHQDLDFKVIAEMVGYPDCHYFYKVFKTVVGKTPSEFRLEYRSDHI